MEMRKSVLHDHHVRHFYFTLERTIIFAKRNKLNYDIILK